MATVQRSPNMRSRTRFLNGPAVLFCVTNCLPDMLVLMISHNRKTLHCGNLIIPYDHQAAYVGQ